MAKSRRLKGGGKVTNPYQKAKYAAHFTIADKNRLRRQGRHKQRHPNDLTI